MGCRANPYKTRKFQICFKHHPGSHKGPQPSWTLWLLLIKPLQQDVGCSSQSVPRVTWENPKWGHQWWEKVQGWIFWEFWWTASGHQTTSEGPVVLHPRVKAGTLLESEPFGDRIISILEFQTLQTCHHTRLCSNKQSRKGWLVRGTTRNLLQAPSWCYAVNQGRHECKEWRLWLSLRESRLRCHEHQPGVCFKAEKLFHCFWSSDWYSWWVPWYQHHMGNQEGPVGWEELKSSMQHKDNKERLACGHKTNKTS